VHGISLGVCEPAVELGEGTGGKVGAGEGAFGVLVGRCIGFVVRGGNWGIC